MTDVEIAAATGVTRERARQVRHNLSQPPSRRQGRHMVSHRALIGAWLKHYSHLSGYLTLSQLHTLIPSFNGVKVSIPKLYTACGEYNFLLAPSRELPFVQAIRPNWQLPNCDLARAWGLSPINFAIGRARYANGTRALWNGRNPARLCDSGHRFAMTNELRRAQRTYLLKTSSCCVIPLSLDETPLP